MQIAGNAEALGKHLFIFQVIVIAVAEAPILSDIAGEGGTQVIILRVENAAWGIEIMADGEAPIIVGSFLAAVIRRAG